MHKIIIMVCVLNTFLTMSVFAAEPPHSPQRNPANFQVHGNTGAGSNLTMLDVLKKQKLQNYPLMTIGKAFDSYSHFSKIEWKEFRDPAGKTYFDCTGKIKKKLLEFGNVASRSLEVKFVVTNDGNYGVVMATLINTYKGGKIEKIVQPDLKGLLNRIYANKEMIFQ